MKPSSEDEILAIVARHFPNAHPSMLLGRGDDCAVLRPGGPLAVSTDIFAENAHFRRQYFTPYDTGFKALAVNISDIGSSGALPTGFSMGLTLTGEEDESWIDAFCEGMSALIRPFNLCVSGGDLSRSSLLNICITAWGELPENLPRGLRRGVARQGDLILLLGDIGLARLGLTLLEKALSSPEEDREHAITQVKKDWPEACTHHLRPFPLVREGNALARFALKHDAGDRIGLMDISDGLSRDLPRLLASRTTGLGASLFVPDNILHHEIRKYAETCGLDAPFFAFDGGEDYALACTCPQELWPDMKKFLTLQQIHPKVIGEVEMGSFTLNGKTPTSEGFDHFSA